MIIAQCPEEVPDACAAVEFPSETHRTLACEATVSLARDPRVTAVCVTCSIARGVAYPLSDLDLLVYTTPEHLAALSAVVEEFPRRPADPHFVPEVSDGQFRPGRMSWTGIDEFELEVGNNVAYARPLFERDGGFQALRAQYLPYYDAALAEQRAVRWYDVTVNHADRARRGVAREIGFDAAERLRLGVKTFLAGLFVGRRVYPIDYAKWVEHQLVDLLGLPELLPPLRALFDVGALDPARLRERADALEALAEQWLGAGHRCER